MNVVLSDEERNHYGTQYTVPVRSIAGTYHRGGVGQVPSIVLGAVGLYLRQNTTSPIPVVSFGEFDRDRYLFTLDEAEAIGLTLLALAETAPAMSAGDSFVTEDEAAELMGISVGSLLDLRRDSGSPSAYRIGGRLVYRRADLEAWIAAHGTA